MAFKFDELVKSCTWQIFNLTKWYITLLTILDVIINGELKIDEPQRFCQFVKIKALSIMPAIIMV